MRRYKKNDLVKVLTGKDKGKTGKILLVNNKTGKIVVENINVVSKHKKKDQKSEAGIIKVPASLQASNGRKER